MRSIVPELIICFIVIVTITAVRLVSVFLHESLGGGPVVPSNVDNASVAQEQLTLSQLIDKKSKEYSWLLRLSVNTLGYLCVIIPGLLIFKYTRKIKYLERSDKSIISNAVRLCFGGASDGERSVDSKNQDKAAVGKRTSVEDCILLFYCLFGLMGSYLTWGVLQEKIMTQEYENADKKKVHFKDSQFLVFTNRVLGFLITAVYLTLKGQLKQRVPMYKYSYASFSNIMSAWFQYEALKFVNFPTQVLAKSCKIIPVMIMGKIISRNKYEFYEYITAIMISVGMIFFLTGSTDESKTTAVTTLTGVLLLTFYMVFDSFTSNWQGELFKTYSMSSIQMMCGVNLFSTLFTAASLSMQGGFSSSLQFAAEHPKFVLDCVVLSISSAIGQLFIFYTIATFGAVVFTIIMTLRQAIAILLSCLIYKHNISFLGVIGVFIVFLAIFLRVYCNQRLKAIKRRHAADASAGKPRLNV
ncbi:adenosine 3'-phospho 5'-phosphosulfate transporter 1 [Toxorhynchites rutilus septentrionalis]|uniref:adenosine 3'-phospho 5'-phosphosulfate transporter 1 n=1 Tax=Toxorhynchites rutilus septentrionalis TaxID=329112 RepID=UPI002478BA5B|nr:adenosine 3'-phospho 5'-phosphosulfate transporter 1 [Toxorhynchites rutilus septentrionalis]XP_055642005.1 adenosine 3'-phospho 5'-phosphosulfate transporter 1 [Toxorhynchites rutilus septentrionalis]